MGLSCSKASLFSSTQYRRHEAWAATAVHDRNYNDRPFIWSICNKIISNDFKTQWTRSEILPSVTLVRKRNNIANCIQNFFADAFRGQWAVLSNKFPNLDNILSCTRVKLESLIHIHLVEFFLINSSLRRRKSSKKASPSTGFTRPLFMSS